MASALENVPVSARSAKAFWVPKAYIVGHSAIVNPIVLVFEFSIFHLL